MKYAVVKIGGSQYKVEEKEQLGVEKLPNKEGETVELSNVLLYVNGEKVEIGSPFLKEVKVKVKVIKHYLGKKLHVLKFKAKTGYRRKTGFRPQLTLLEIKEIAS